MIQNIRMGFFRRVPGLLISLCLFTNQVFAAATLPDRSCENYQSDLAAVDQFLRGREVSVRPMEGSTNVTMKIKELEARRAKLQAQKALLQGMELLRKRHIDNLAYLNNEKHCDFYPTPEKRQKCATNDPAFPPKSFFELQDEKTLKKLDQKLDKAQSDATNVYGMEQTIQKLLGSQDALKTLLTGTNPPLDGALATGLMARCTEAAGAAVTEAAGLCSIFNGRNGDSANAAKYAKLVEVLNNFGKAFYHGYKYKEAGTDTAAKSAARSQAEAALRLFQAKLTGEPLQGGEGLLTTLDALTTFGDTVKKRYLKKVDCLNRKARFGAGPGAGTDEAQIREDIAVSGSGSGYRRGSGYTGNAAANASQLGDCDVSLADQRSSIDAEHGFRATLRANLSIAGDDSKFSLSSDFVLNKESLVSLISLAETSTSNHKDAIQNWLSEQQFHQSNRRNATPYLFDRSENGETKNGALTKKINDPTNPTRKISQGNNLRQLLVQSANRAMLERKLNSTGADRVVTDSDTLTVGEINDDTKLAKHFLRQILLYQSEVFGGELTGKCPGPTLQRAGAIDSASSSAVLQALHECMLEVDEHYGHDGSASNIRVVKDRINLELSHLNEAFPVGDTNPDAGSAEVAKTRELRKQIELLVRLKCTPANLRDVSYGRTGLCIEASPADQALRYLTTSSGSILARLAPGTITAASSEADIRSEIRRICTARLPAPVVAPVVAPAPVPAVDPAAPVTPAETSALTVPVNLRGHLETACGAHDLVYGSPSPTLVEYSKEENEQTNTRLTYLENHHVTFLPDGSIASSSPTSGWGAPLLLGGASAFAGVLAPTLMAIPGIQSETNMLVEQAKWQATWNAMQEQNTAFYMANGGAFGFGAPFAPFAMQGGGFGGGGFNPGGDAAYGSYLGAL